MPVLSTKTIINKDSASQLSKKSFLVKDYQRGYRWRKPEIIKLLDDLDEFESVGGSTYCLQPIVVKPAENTDKGSSLEQIINELKGNEECNSLSPDSYWELVDGQQRLTTILLILDYCNINNKDYISLPFSIRYCQIRPIDRTFIKNAMDTIKTWFESFGASQRTKINRISDKLLEVTKIIWFEPDPGASSEQIFKKINVGKIRLTSAELFKAFLLNPENHINTDKKTLKEISYEWDQLEKNLADDDFWFFACNQNEATETRIDYLLSIYCQQNIDTIVDKAFDEQDELYSFLVISEYIDQKKDEIEDIFIKTWESIKGIYSKLYYWFKDRELYHYIGFLISTAGRDYKNTASTIIKLLNLTLNKSKTECKKLIKKEVLKIIERIDLDLLTYSERSKVFKVLLLFNLLTMVQSKTNARFSFPDFKNKNDEQNKWDIEHIHSQADDEKLRELKLPDARISLLQDFREQFVKLECQQSDIQMIDDYITQCENGMLENDWLNAVHTIVGVFGNCDENGLGNLTLLPASINRSYHNDLFPTKREYIIAKDMGEEFIPVCTKNVFLKMYTKKPQPLMWDRDDAANYLAAIKSTFETFKNDID